MVSQFTSEVEVNKELLEIANNYPIMQKGVHSVIMSLKEKGGKRTDEPCLTFLVDKKVSKESLEEQDIIPSMLHGFATDVIEREKEMAVVSGCLMYHGSGVGSGTGGIFINYGDETRQYVITCHHVVSSPGGQPTYGAVVRSDQCLSGKWIDIGWVYKWKNIVYGEVQPPQNEIDIAIIKIYDNVVNPIGYTAPRCGTARKISRASLGNITVNKQLWRCGKRTAYVTGTLLGIGQVTLWYSSTVFAYFKNAILCSNMPAIGGDSGAILSTFDLDGEGKYRPIGITYGSSGASSQLSKVKQMLGSFYVSQRIWK